MHIYWRGYKQSKKSLKLKSIEFDADMINGFSCLSHCFCQIFLDKKNLLLKSSKGVYVKNHHYVWLKKITYTFSSHLEFWIDLPFFHQWESSGFHIFPPIFFGVDLIWILIWSMQIKQYIICVFKMEFSN